jgi:hypothetical protein
MCWSADTASGVAPTGRPREIAIRGDVHTVVLPYAARRVGLEEPPRLVWGTQFMLEAYPEWHELDVETELPRARAAGLTSIRTNLRWDNVEPHNVAPDRFDWTVPDRRLRRYVDEGFDLLVTVVAYPRWATVYQCGYDLRPGMEAEWREFVRQAALRYGRHVSGWEIGNEPDGKTVVTPSDWKRTPGWGRGEPTVPLGGCWGDRPEAYLRFVAAAYEEIKAVDVAVPVSFGSLAYAPGFHLDLLDRYLAIGGASTFDYLGVHWFPDAAYEPPDGLERHRVLVETLERHGADKPVWLTETYRLTHPDVPETEARQVTFLTKELVEIIAQPEIERVYWYGWIDLPDELFDGVDDYERGIVRNDHTPKPALQIMPDTIQYTAGRVHDASTKDIVVYRFDRSRTRSRHLIAWTRDGRAGELRLPAAAGVSATSTRYPKDMLLEGRCCNVVTVPEMDGVITIPIDEDARFVKVPVRGAVDGSSGAGSGPPSSPSPGDASRSAVLPVGRR